MMMMIKWNQRTNEGKKNFLIGTGKENGEWIRIEDENVDVWEVTIGFGNQLIRLPVRQLLLDFNKTSPEVTFSDVTLANRMT